MLLAGILQLALNQSLQPHIFLLQSLIFSLVWAVAMALPTISGCVAQFYDVITLIVPVWQRLISNVQRFLRNRLSRCIEDSTSEPFVLLLGGVVIALARLQVLELAGEELPVGALEVPTGRSSLLQHGFGV